MRIVVVPSLGIGASQNPLGDSSFGGFWVWMCKIVENNPDVFMYYLARKDVEWLGLKHERIEMLYEDIDVGWYVIQGQPPMSFTKLFSPTLARYPVDAVVTDRTAAVPWMTRSLLEPRARFGEVVPVVVEESMALDEQSAMQEAPIVELIAKMMGYVLGWTSFHSEWERTLAFKMMRRYLSPFAVNEVWQRSQVCGRQLNINDVDETVKGVERSDVFTLFVGQRLNAAKKGTKLLEIYDQCYAAGREIRVVATSPRSESFALTKWRRQKKIFPEVEFFPDCTRREFLRKAAQAHIALNISEKGEGFSLGYLETLLCGPVGVFRKDNWFEGSLGEDVVGDYPYMFKSEAEAAAMIRLVLNNYDEAQKHAEGLRMRIRAAYEGVDLDQKLFDFVRYVTEKVTRVKVARGMVGLFQECIDKMKSEFTLDELWRVVVDNSQFLSMDRPIRGGQASKAELYWWLKMKGFVDLCDGPVARFRK